MTVLFFVHLCLFVYLKVYEGAVFGAGFKVNIMMILCTVSCFCIFVYLNNKCIFNKLMELNVLNF